MGLISLVLMSLYFRVYSSYYLIMVIGELED